MTLLVLVRHGRPAGADGLCLGHHDLPLADDGRAALDRLAGAWRRDADAGRALVPAPARLVASDLARARDSARAFGAAFGLAAEPEPRLREMDFGAWDGRPWAELEAADGARLGAWMADWAAAPAPGGEAFPDVARRAAAWLAAVRAEAAGAAARGGSPAGGSPNGGSPNAGPSAAAGPVLAVAHSGSIRALLCAAMDWPLAAAFRVRVDYARATAVRLPPPGDARGAELLFLNADRVPGRA